jgi:hypothetical protein
LPAYDTSSNGEQPKPKQQANDTTEQTPREKCWYWNRFGGCPKKNCPRDHTLKTDEEKAKVPDSFWSKGRKGASKGPGSDTEGHENGKGGGDDNRGEAKGEGKGPKIVGCRCANLGEVCPHGERCHWAWARDKPHGPPMEFDRRSLSERRKDKDGKVPKEDTSDNDSVGSAGFSSGSLGVERGIKPKTQE